MDRRTQQDSQRFNREIGTERRAIRYGGDRRRHHPALRLFFMPVARLMEKLQSHQG